MLKKTEKKTEPTMSLQEMGTEAQKTAVARRVADRLKELRKEMSAGTVRGPFSMSFVLRWIKVDKHTLKRSYHAESAKKVEAFLLETDRAHGVVVRKQKKPSKKRSLREQMAALAVEAEAMRLRMQCKIDDLNDQLQSKSKNRRPDAKNFRSVIRMDAPRSRAKGAAGASLAA